MFSMTVYKHNMKMQVCKNQINYNTTLIKTDAQMNKVDIEHSTDGMFHIFVTKLTFSTLSLLCHLHHYSVLFGSNIYFLYLPVSHSEAVLPAAAAEPPSQRSTLFSGRGKYDSCDLRRGESPCELL